MISQEVMDKAARVTALQRFVCGICPEGTSYTLTDEQMREHIKSVHPELADATFDTEPILFVSKITLQVAETPSASTKEQA